MVLTYDAYTESLEKQKEDLSRFDKMEKQIQEFNRKLRADLRFLSFSRPNYRTIGPIAATSQPNGCPILAIFLNVTSRTFECCLLNLGSNTINDI